MPHSVSDHTPALRGGQRTSTHIGDATCPRSHSCEGQIWGVKHSMWPRTPRLSSVRGPHAQLLAATLNHLMLWVCLRTSCKWLAFENQNRIGSIKITRWVGNAPWAGVSKLETKGRAIPSQHGIGLCSHILRAGRAAGVLLSVLGQWQITSFPMPFPEQGGRGRSRAGGRGGARPAPARPRAGGSGCTALAAGIISQKHERPAPSDCITAGP